MYLKVHNNRNYNMSEIRINSCIAKKYKLIKKIGGGSFGEIFLAECLNTNLRVAIKFVCFFYNLIGGMQQRC